MSAAAAVAASVVVLTGCSSDSSPSVATFYGVATFDDSGSPFSDDASVGVFYGVASFDGAVSFITDSAVGQDAPAPFKGEGGSDDDAGDASDASPVQADGAAVVDGASDASPDATGDGG